MLEEMLFQVLQVFAIYRARGQIAFQTADLIRDVEGRFIACHGCTPHQSRNAQWGRELSRARRELGIVKARVRLGIRDDLGRRTCTAVWQLA